MNLVLLYPLHHKIEYLKLGQMSWPRYKAASVVPLFRKEDDLHTAVHATHTETIP